MSLKEFMLDFLFPKFCLICKREGSYLCQDCFSMIDILEHQYCPFCFPPKTGNTCEFCKRTKSLDGLYAASSTENFVARKLSVEFKNIKELSKTLSLLIIAHLIKLDKVEEVLSFTIWPLNKELAEELSKNLKIPIKKSENVLLVDITFSSAEKMEKEAKKLKKQGVKKVLGIVPFISLQEK